MAWCLDKAAGGTFEPASAPAWLAEGRRHRHLLPWERERVAYAARPHCYVQRNWARVALKTLAEQLATVDDDIPVTFWFDGSVLMIRCAGKVIAMPAEGPPLDTAVRNQGWSAEAVTKATERHCCSLGLGFGAHNR